MPTAFGVNSFRLQIVRQPTTRAALAAEAAAGFGEMIKAVVDVERRIMAIGGELHADEETALLDDGSSQANLWGINLYPAEVGEGWVEFDSMINVRPGVGNRSRGVDNPERRAAVLGVVASLVSDA